MERSVKSRASRAARLARSGRPAPCGEPPLRLPPTAPSTEPERRHPSLTLLAATLLLATGLERELQGAPAATAAERLARSQAVATLLLPGEMGERCKVIALARGFEGPLIGFGFRDLADRL